MNSVSELSMTTSTKDETATISDISQSQDQMYNELLNQLNTLVAHSQFNEISQILSQPNLNLPQEFLTQFLSSLIDNSQNMEVIDLLLRNGANINSVIHSNVYNINESEKITLLMYSIISSNLRLFEVIMSHHPNILLEDSVGRNAVVYSILFNDDSNKFMLLKLLSENNEVIKTIVKVDNVTHNLLTLAAQKNKKNFVEMLLDTKIDVNYQTQPNFDTALHIAVNNDYESIAEIIYRNENFNKDTVNAQGKTAKQLAKEKRGKIYYTLFAREQENNNKNNMVNNNLLGNNLMMFSSNNNLMNKGIGGGINKLNFNDKNNNFQNFGGVNNNTPNNSFSDKANKKFTVNKEENLTVPIEISNEKLYSFLKFSNNNNSKLCIKINQSQDELRDEINKMKKTLNEKLNLIKDYEVLINEKNSAIATLQNKIEQTENDIQKFKRTTTQQKQQISELHTQINEIDKIIQNQVDKSSESNITFLINKFNSVSYNDTYIIRSLQKDLLDYQQYVHEIISHKRPTINEIIDNIQKTVDEINSDFVVNLYGSYATGLCLPWSDIDVVLTSKTEHKTDEYFLGRLYIKLTQKPWIKSHKYIENTNIPIIKLVSNDQFNFHIDISVECERHFGLKCVDLIKSYLNAYSVLEPIVLALKTLLANGNLNNPYTGGLSSYGLILMVVSFIQSQIDSKKFNSKSQTLLGETFINVLGHYGIFFDFSKFIILTYPINNDVVDNDKDSILHMAPDMHELIIVDPLNKINNVAKSTFQYMNIKMAFMIAYMVAKEDCECGCHYDILQNKIQNTEHCILKRIFNSVKRFSEANKVSMY